MKKYILGISCLVLITISLFTTGWKSSPVKAAAPQSLVAAKDSVYNAYINQLYTDADLATAGLSLPVFEKALTGFYNLKKAGKLCERSILTIADFDQLSTRKRLYIIDIDQRKLLVNTWVAHGERSGGNEANYFSNTDNSFASSLGFYVTGEVYFGKHGRSLRLDGVDKGFNDLARSRSIVVHGADYVGQGTINALGRLGRSQGCPAVPTALANKVINTIEAKTVLFINKSEDRYASRYLDESQAATYAYQAMAAGTVGSID